MNDPIPETLLALWLAETAAAGGTLVHVARSDARLARLEPAAHTFAEGAVEFITLPGWDVLPYDPARPSPAAIGHRIAALLALAKPATRPRLVLTSAEATLQRVPSARLWAGAIRTLSPGDPLDPAELAADLATLGYQSHARADEPGDLAARGQVIDLWPAASPEPARLTVEHGRLAALHCFDPLTQRSGHAIPSVRLLPAIEFPDPGDLPPLHPLATLLPGATWVLDPETEDRWDALAEQIADAHAALSKAHRILSGTPSPILLYLTPAQARQAATPRRDPTPTATPLPPPATTAALVATLRTPTPTILACPEDPTPLLHSLARRNIPARLATNWPDALTGGIAALHLDIPEGFERPGLRLIPLARLVHTHAHATAREDAPRTGDAVVHAEHGVACRRGLRRVEGEERVDLAYAHDTELLAETWDLDQIWRLGGESARLAPDHLGGDAWQRTRSELDAEIAAAAAHLTTLADARLRATAPKITPTPLYTRIARRFPYAPSPDQQTTIDAVLADLAAGHPMDRLVCGDVGFGKTEIAIRAAAAVASAGYQVAIAAPTTVLARQHLATFRRRFEGTGIHVEGLIRPTATEAHRVRQGLASGSVAVVIGTQSLAAPALRFHRLGLTIIDEEQRFGEATKTRLAAPGPGIHTLAMTATPIPRTLQAALVGLRDCSVIATPPRRRQATRTFVLPWDPAVARAALLREHARGGQSFIVVPRIERLRQAEAELRDLVPELALTIAHGRLPPDALDDAVTSFADGHGNVLLATNIIEAGLDIPRANLILVLDAERFGLAQLHQLRGRVGRSTRQGAAYFLTAPGRRLAATTTARLRTLEALASLGAGAALSAADLDLRGGGYLFGTEQAGHVQRVGTEMYQSLLARALATQRGDPAQPRPATIHGMAPGHFPAAWIPEPNLRLSSSAASPACATSPASTPTRSSSETASATSPPKPSPCSPPPAYGCSPAPPA